MLACLDTALTAFVTVINSLSSIRGQAAPLWGLPWLPLTGGPSSFMGLGPQGDPGPADTLIVDFWPPGK